MTNIWFTSDTHHEHRRICELSNRPFSSVEEMNEGLRDNWNAVVKSDDIVYNLGDFSFSKNIDAVEAYLNSLNGIKFHLIGNHCQIMTQNKERLLNNGTIQCLDHYKEIKIDKKSIVLFHFPLQEFNKMSHGGLALHGHSHGSVKPYGKQVDVGIDTDFILGHKVWRPYEWTEVKEFMEHQPIITHHN